jgi:5-methylcytosine-specific restriction enzyme subunit McrC
MNRKHQITVYEHESLKVGQKGFKAEHLQVLQRYHGEIGVPYFTLIHQGIRFCEYVGVLQIGALIIEVLPKADKSPERDETRWRDLLIYMLRTVGAFNIQAPSHANLGLKSNAILELYFTLYVQEVERLVHQGLVKQYHKIESNRNALKGSIHFPKHIRQNLVHQEKFYVRHTTYSPENRYNQILLKGLSLLAAINTNAFLSSRISNLLLNFPELEDIRITEKTFERLTFNRKTETYRSAIEIARLLLLNYHPDLSTGRNYVLALLFDMNLLWERYIAKLLQKSTVGQWKVKAQNAKGYWIHEASSHARKLRPDILLQNTHLLDSTENIVIDTKWKVLKDTRPADDDLRQMFAYCHFFSAAKSYLLYPSSSSDLKVISGSFLQPHLAYNCGIIQLPVDQIKEKGLGETLLKALFEQQHVKV